MMDDTGTKAFTCPKCETTLKSFSGYAHHMLAYHGINKGVPPLDRVLSDISDSIP